MNKSDETPNQTLWRLIKEIKFSMFATTHANGHIHSHPMTTQNKDIDEDNVLWFFMSRAGDPVKDLKLNPRVAVIYADPGESSYVSVSGDAAIVDNKAKAREMWNTFADAWFPGGVDDPDLALVAVKIEHAHFWDVTENKMVQIYKMAKSAITGTPPDLGRDGEVRLSGSREE